MNKISRPFQASNFKKRLMRNTKGSVYVIFAITLVPLIAATGAAWDYGHYIDVKAKIQQAVDAASLTAAQVGETQLNAGNTDWSEPAVKAGETYLNGNINQFNFHLSEPRFSVETMKPTATSVSAKVTYSVSIRPQFMQILGFNEVRIQGTSVSTVSLPTSVNVSIVFDVSPSMAIAGSENDMKAFGLLLNRLYPTHWTNPKKTCFFACHDPMNKGYWPTERPYIDDIRDYNNALPPKSAIPPIYIRLDYAKMAGCTLVNYILALNNGGNGKNAPTDCGNSNSTTAPAPGTSPCTPPAKLQNQFTISLYTMAYSLKTVMGSAKSGNGFVGQCVQSQGDANNLNKAINTIDFDQMSVVFPTLPSTTQYSASVTHYADTDFKSVFTGQTFVEGNHISDGLDKVIGDVAGNGLAGQNPKQFLFLITDGLYDVETKYKPSVTARYDYKTTAKSAIKTKFPDGNDQAKVTQPFDSDLCANLKAKGVTIGVVYTRYIPDYASDPGSENALIGSNAPGLPIIAGATRPSNAADSQGTNYVVKELTACATNPSMFQEADNLASLQKGLQTLLNNARSQQLHISE